MSHISLRNGAGESDFDVAIVGGSLAGASAALALRGSGLSCAIFERNTFPRRKPCGEGLSPLGVKLVSELAGPDVLEGGQPFTAFVFSFDKVKRRIALPKGSRGCGIARQILDTRMLAAASAVHPLIDDRIRALSHLPGAIELRGDAGVYRCRYVLLACGISSPLFRQAGFTPAIPPQERFGTSFAIETDAPLSDIHILPKKGFEVFCTKTGPRRANIAFLGPGLRIRDATASSAISAILNDIAEHTGIEGRIIEEPIFSGPFGRRYTPAALSRVFLLGDSAESFDPIGGMGMTHAIFSGVHAARALISGATAPGNSPISVAQMYDSLRARTAAPLRLFTSLVLEAAHSPHGAKILGMAERTGLSRLCFDLLHEETQHGAKRIAFSLLSVVNAALRRLSDRGIGSANHEQSEPFGIRSTAE